MVQTVRVLLIDDDPAFLCVASDALGAVVELRTISSAHVALAQILDWTPDVILLDLLLDDVDGFTFLERLIELKLATQPSILCTIDGPGAGTRLLPIDGWPVSTLLRSSTRMQLQAAVLNAAAARQVQRPPLTTMTGH
jgi:CheY-like chemotaxis protein